LVDKIVSTAVKDKKMKTPFLPLGAVLYIASGPKEIIVVEEAPKQRTIMNSRGNTFQVALPYVVYLFYLEQGFMTHYKSRIFFRTSPLSSENDALMLCNLTHVITDSMSSYGIGAFCTKANVKTSDSLVQKINANLEYFWNTEFADMVNSQQRVIFSKVFRCQLRLTRALKALKLGKSHDEIRFLSLRFHGLIQV